ncbi:MAG: NAD(P)-binding domain-containing protein, partial [Planctomycetia bacterium]
MAGDSHTKLLQALENRSARIGVIGLGYVGLPLVRIFLRAGFPVVGFDCDAKKVVALKAGKSYIKHVPDEEIAAMNAGGRFEATADMTALAAVDAVVICVPTPLTEHHEPDMSYVVGTAKQIRDALRPGQLVVLESTT